MKDANEFGLAGWTIQLLDAAGNVIDTTTTSAANAAGPGGRFCFSNVAAGSYTVREVAQTGWQQTYPAAPGTHSVTIGAGSAPSNLLFGNTQGPGTGVVCATKFDDKNGNGVQDPGEPVLSGWTIQLWPDGSPQQMSSVVTDARGNACISVGYPAGGLSNTYHIAEVMQSGWQQTQPGANGSYTVQVSASKPETTVLFGNRQSSQTGTAVCGTKFEDRNGNGIQDPGEPGLPGWTIQAFNDKGNLVVSATTDKEGKFCFEPLKPALYTFSEVMQPGWQQTVPGGAGAYTVQLTAQQAETKPLLFGNAQSTGESLVCGIKFEDKNGNGRQDSDEMGLVDWTIEVRDASGRVVATAVTDKSGKYCFRGLRPAVYTFAEVMQPGYQQTFPGAPFTHTVQVASGHTAGSFDFGNQKKPEDCCLSFDFMGGRADNFATGNGPESGQPSSALLAMMSSTTSFDSDVSDRFLGHTITLPAGNCVESASLEFRAKPMAGKPANDTVSLRFAGVAGPPIWGSYLGAGQSSSGLLSNAWTTSNYSAGNLFSLDLANLPGGVNLIPTLNAQRFLDFMVQDDTSVDYVKLTAKFCECATTSGPVGVDLGGPRQISVLPSVSIRLVVDSSDASVNDEPGRLPAPAVLRDGTSLVPFRWIGETMGAEVKWDPDERRATFILGERTVELWVGTTRARVNGKELTLSYAPTLIQGVTFVPVRFIVENLGAEVKYNPDDRSITITSPK